MNRTGISWATHTWNVVEGCSHAGEGCRSCWAERFVNRFAGIPGHRLHGLASGGKWTGEVRAMPDLLDQPLRLRMPAEIFVASRADLFHPKVPFDFIAATFAVMAAAQQHTFIVLTKRPARAREFFVRLDDLASEGFGTRAERLSWLRSRAPQIQWPSIDVHADGADWPLSNVWLGVSVSTQRVADSLIPILLATPAAHRWVSVEPILEHVDLRLCDEEPLDGGCMEDRRHHIGSVIVGGEGGPGARLCDVSWARSLRGQCKVAGVPYYCKQAGSKPLGWSDEWREELTFRELAWRTER